MAKTPPLQTLDEFSVGQLWQPADNNRTRLINGFGTARGRQIGTPLIRYASPSGRIDRCTIEEMRTWVVAYAATVSKIITDTPKTERQADEPVTNEVKLLQVPELRLPFQQSDRCIIAIDSAYIYRLIRAVNLYLDYRRMLDYFNTVVNIIHANYYTLTLPDSSSHALNEFLSYNGYLVRTIPAQEHVNDHNRRIISGDISVQLTVDLLTFSSRIDHVIVFINSQKYVPLLQALKERGVIITLVGALTAPPLVNDMLRRNVDNFFDIRHIIEKIARPPLEATR